jgi:hypothetical protein
MRRMISLILLFLLLLSCQALSTTGINPTETSFPTSSPAVIDTHLPTGSPTPGSFPSPVPSPIPTAEPATGFTVKFHPDGPLFSGDLVSLEVIAPPGSDMKDKKVQVELLGDRPVDLGSAVFGAFGIGGRSQATLTWAWDTSGLAPGDYQLAFQVLPEGSTWTTTVSIYPAEEVPPPEPQADWETVNSECCVVNYITGTDAARDIEQLLEVADEQGRMAVKQMGVDFSDPIPVTLVPRVLGHGGFAANEIYISYLDRNYAGNDFSQVLHHEMVHLLDGRLGGELRPSLLVEGLAVYLAGGHYKKEPLFSRAAALVEMGRYIPLTALADSFYTSQHEIGYLEGAALVQYLVNTYGWQAFDSFYRDIKPQSSGKQSDAIEAALLDHFGLSLSQMEGTFLTNLYHQQINPDVFDDLRLTIAYYDAVRRYQQLLDPSAYFLTAWLPDGPQMRERGIVADFLRHPNGPDNQQIETLLIEADEDLRAGDYPEAEKTLVTVNRFLDLIEAGEPELVLASGFLP